MDIACETAGQSMSNGNSISSELINRRLGSGGQKNFYEPDLQAVDDDQSLGSDMSIGFIIKMLVLFVAVGGGTYFFEGPDYSWYEIKQTVGDLSQFQL
jgi:hypothetical protein